MANNHNVIRSNFLNVSLLAGVALLLSAPAQCTPVPTYTPTPRCTLASLDLITRAEWGATDPDLDSVEGLFDPVINPGGWLTYTQPLAEALDTIIIHHSAIPLSDGPLEIQRLHKENKGYADIGYHFLIDDKGLLYEGRSLTVRGAHTGGRNTGAIGIALLGDFELAAPTDAQLTTLRTLCACLIDEYTIVRLAGHRDFQPGITDCPGNNLEILLPGLADELGIEFGA